MFHVQLCSFRSVMGGVMRVPVGCVRMVRGGFMVTCLVMLCRLAMVSSCMIVVFGRLMMMLCCLFGHVSSLRCGWAGSV
jgi:hypothetical protein